MKKLLLKNWMLLIALLFANAGAWAQTWEIVGTAGFSAGFIEYPSLAIDDGTPYISYKDGANSGKVTVKKFDGTSWVTVGTEGFTSSNIGKPCLAVSDGTPYVAYQGNLFFDGQKAMVKKFVGSSWVDAGSSSPSSGTVGLVNMCIGNGTIYVVFEDYANGDKATVRKLNGTSWDAVGATPSVGKAEYPAIAVNNGTPYIAFEDGANGEKATVRKFNGTDWENVGTPGFSDGGLVWTALAFDNETPYLAFIDYGNDSKVTVMKFDGTSWENVGAAGFSINPANHPSLAISNGTPCLAYIDRFENYILSSVSTLVVKKFNGTSWEDAGSAPVSPDDADYSSLATYNGALYVSYQDNGNNYKATVRKYGTPAVPMQLKFTTTDDNQGIDLPLFGTVNCTVDWGDGEPTETFTTEGTQWHTYATAGTYTVSISGTLTQFGYYDTGNSKGWDGSGYLTEVVDFGSVGLTSLSGAFANADNLSSVPASLPATVTDLSYCFFVNDKASITNLNSWDVSHVTNMSDAFYKASAFNQNISSWDVSAVTNMEDMFKRAFAFNQPIGIWDVSSVTNMEDMFRQDSAFNQPIGDWDVSSVTTMECIFQSASAFNQDINDWVVGSVKNISGMFSGASAFNQRISDWDVSTVTDMSWMFSGASAFDQSLTGWDINSVTTMEDMFKNVTLSTINYDSILTAWAAQPVQSDVVFNGGNSKYSAGAAATARGELTDPPNNWTITDGGQVFSVTTQAASAITATTATGNGTIVSVGSGNATNRGVIYYPYSGTDIIIGDAGVTNVSEEPGPFVAGAFTASLTGLSVNARYNARAHATNTDDGTKYGARVDFWTLANVPSPPAVINPTAISLDVAVNANGNPADVLFAIQDSALVSQYVQINGLRGATVVWQTAADWDTITITGLTTGVTYYFRVKAKNDNNEETAFGLATAQNTCSNPTNGGEIGGEQAISSGSTPDTLVNEAEASNYGGTLEYQWQQASLTDSTDFADITDAEAKFYVPGVLSSTTWFRRLARVACKADWNGAAETNVVKITVQHIPEVIITAPADGGKVYTNPITISGTASDTDGNLSYVQVKLNSGTWQTATGSDNWTIDFNLAPGKNTILARAADSTSLYSDTATINVLLSIQIISIPKGWSAISSYLAPLNPDLPVMMDEITDNNNLVIMLSENGIYWPPYNTNTIGNWSVEKGYKMKMNQSQEFTVRGDTLANRSLSLSQGYHIIPVLSNDLCPVSAVFTDPLNDIFFMYDVKTNALYWPQGEIFSLTTLEPGKGYIASFNKAVTLTYPAYSGLKAGIISESTEPEMNGPWSLNRTGVVHFISIKNEAVNKLENASFIGAFDSFGNCIGYTKLNGSGDNYLLSVYGNDAFTDAKDGGEEGELISFRSYNSSKQNETELIAEYNISFPNSDGLFASNGQSAIVNFKESSTGIGEAGIAVDVQIYPNPAKDLVNIATKGFRTLEGLGTLMTAEGKLVKTFIITGNQTQLNVQDLQAGIYILRIETAENVVVKRLVIQ